MTVPTEQYDGRPSAVASGQLIALDLSEYYAPTGGGVRTYLDAKVAYVRAQPAIRHILVVPDEAAQTTVVANTTRYGIASPYIPTQQPYRVLWNSRAVQRIIEHERPHIIEVGSAYAAPWMVQRPARRLQIPMVWFCHGNLPRIIAPDQQGTSPTRRTLARGVKAYVRAIAARVDAVLAASHYVAEDLRALGVHNVSEVSLGVDTELFHPQRRCHRADVLGRFGLGGGPLAVFAGRLTSEKQLGVAIRAWHTLADTGATLLLVGAGPLRERLRREARGARVAFADFVANREQMADLMAAADVYLATGPVETFGLAAHEAMASGTPVLSVDRGAVPGHVRRAGAGRTFPLGDAGALAAEMRALLQSPRELFGDAGRRFVVAEHRVDVAFDRIFDVYRQLIAGAV